MALKNNWVDKIDGVDDVLAEDINKVAQAVILLEEAPNTTVDQEYNPESQSAQSGVAVNQAINQVKNVLSNSLVGNAAAEDGLRLDDVSPIAHDMSVSVVPYNLINQEDFFSSNSYELKGDVGGIYLFRCIPKADASFDSITSGIFDVYDGGMVNHNFRQDRLDITVTFEAGHSYLWNTEGGSPSDLFESVEMIKTNAEVLQYQKNLTDVKWDVTVASRTATKINVPCDVTLTIQKTAGTVLVYKSNDGFVTPVNLKTFTSSTTFCELKIEHEKGYEYRVATTGTQYIEYIQTEVGEASEYEEYVEPIECQIQQNGEVSGFQYLYPNTTFVAKDCEITANYNKDINIAFSKLEKLITNI